jgi:hypothetical protein
MPRTSRRPALDAIDHGMGLADIVGRLHEAGQGRGIEMRDEKLAHRHRAKEIGEDS